MHRDVNAAKNIGAIYLFLATNKCRPAEFQTAVITKTNKNERKIITIFEIICVKHRKLETFEGSFYCVGICEGIKTRAVRLVIVCCISVDFNPYSFLLSSPFITCGLSNPST